MATPTSSDIVVFRHPFRIAGLDGTQAAGRYLVETGEEPTGCVSSSAPGRLITYIQLSGRSGTGKSAHMVSIDPAALTAALAGDIETEPLSQLEDFPGLRGASDPIPGRLLKFRNDQGALEIRTGAKMFYCAGVSPPRDHPYIYIDMGDQDTILCLYCATLFRFDPQLGPFSADPPECLYAAS
jgi:uncharacterized Zn-finger protein